MNPEEIDAQITEYTNLLYKLGPTLRPTGDIPFSKIGLLNTARRKEKQYRAKIEFLSLLKNNPKLSELPDEVITQVLSGKPAPPEFVRPPDTPTGQLMFLEKAPTQNDETEEIYESVRRTYGH